MHGVNLKPGKCELFQPKVLFLGRIVSNEGIRLKPVLHLEKSVPKTVNDVRKVMGFVHHYSQNIKDFAKIAKPMYDLLKSPEETTKDTMHPVTKQGRRAGQLPSNHPVTWTMSHQEILEKLISVLTSPSAMAHPDFSKPYVLHTDVSEEGLGAVLYQKQAGTICVIAYGSRSLSPAEKNYHLHSGKLEFLALKMAICDLFHDYLYYAPSFTVYTDNNPLTYVLSSAKLNVTGLRWTGELADFNFIIWNWPGRINVDADTVQNAIGYKDAHGGLHRRNNPRYLEGCRFISSATGPRKGPMVYRLNRRSFSA